MHNKLSLIFLVLLFTGGLFAQDSKDLRDESSTEYVYEEGVGLSAKEAEGENHDQEVIDDENRAITDELKSQGIDKEKFQAMMNDLKEFNPKDRESLDMLEKGELSQEEAEALVMKTMTKLPDKLLKKYTGEGAGGIDKNVESAMNKGLESFQKVPYEVAYEHIKARVNQSKAAPLFRAIPKSYALLTNLLRDKVAPKKFFGILKDRKRLVLFACLSLSLIVIGGMVKRRRKNQNLAPGEAFIHGLGHFVLFSSIKLGLIWYFFNPEITPIIRVIRETYS